MNLLENAKDKIKEQKYIEALNILKELSQKDNGNDVVFEIAKTYFFLKNFEKSQELFNKLLNSNFSLHSSLFLAKIEIYKNNLNKALEILLKEKHYNNTELLLEIAHIYELLEDKSNMLQIYEKILDIEPNNINVKFKLFTIYQANQNTQKALITAKSLLKYKSLTLRRKNSILNYIEYATKQSVLKSVPQILFISLTSKCNLHCVMCDSNSFKYKLTKKAEKEIINLLPKIQDITWCGGEPLLYDNIENLFDLAYKNSVNQVIITNGLLLNDNIINKLIKYNIITHISIDAPNKELYEKIRKGSNFDILINNLLILKNKTKNIKFDLYLNCIVMKENYKHLEDMIFFANKFGFTKIFFLALNSRENYDEIIEYLKKKIPTYYNLAKKYNITIESSLFDFLTTKKDKRVDNSTLNNLYCKLPWIGFYITYSGMVKFSCICNIFESKSLLKDKSILEIWNSKEVVDIRSKITNYKNKDLCKDCINGLYSWEYRNYYKKNIR